MRWALVINALYKFVFVYVQVHIFINRLFSFWVFIYVIFFFIQFLNNMSFDTLVNLILFYMQKRRIRYPIVELLVLHCLEVHFEPFQVNQKKLGPFLDHHLPGGHLLGVARFAVELISEFQIFLIAELFQAIAKRHVLLDVHRQVHKCFLAHALILTHAALGD